MVQRNSIQYSFVGTYVQWLKIRVREHESWGGGAAAPSPQKKWKKISEKLNFDFLKVF